MARGKTKGEMAVEKFTAQLASAPDEVRPVIKAIQLQTQLLIDNMEDALGAILEQMIEQQRK